MNKTKTLSILVGILVVLNIALLVFLLFGRAKGPKRGGHHGKGKPSRFIQKTFDFDEKQMAQFDQSKESHFENLRELHSELSQLSESFYLIDRNEDSSKSDSLMSEINSLNQEIYMRNLKHFEEVRSICTPDQVDGMEAFIKELVKRQRGKRGKRRKGRR